jgi:hypothetical protein
MPKSSGASISASAAVLFVPTSSEQYAALLRDASLAPLLARRKPLVVRAGDLVLVVDPRSFEFRLASVLSPASAGRVRWRGRGSCNMLVEENDKLRTELLALVKQYNGNTPGSSNTNVVTPLVHADVWRESWAELTMPVDDESIQANVDDDDDENVEANTNIDTNNGDNDLPLPRSGRKRRKSSFGPDHVMLEDDDETTTTTNTNTTAATTAATTNISNKRLSTGSTRRGAADDDDEFVADDDDDDAHDATVDDEEFAAAPTNGAHPLHHADEIDEDDDDDEDEDDELLDDFGAAGGAQHATLGGSVGDFVISFSRRAWDAAAAMPFLPKTMESRIARLPRGAARGGTRGRPPGRGGSGLRPGRPPGRGRGRIPSFTALPTSYGGSPSAPLSSSAGVPSAAQAAAQAAAEMLPMVLDGTIAMPMNGDLAMAALRHVREADHMHPVARELEVDAQIAVALGELPGSIVRDDTAVTLPHGARSALLCSCDHSTYGCGYVHAARAEAVILRRTVELLSELYGKARELAGITLLTAAEASARQAIRESTKEAVTAGMLSTTMRARHPSPQSLREEPSDAVAEADHATE